MFFDTCQALATAEDTFPVKKYVREDRSSERKKIINGRVHVTRGPGSSSLGKLIDISMQGVGILLDDPLVAQQVYSIECHIWLNGSRVSLRLRVVTIHCILVGGQGFRIGLQFVTLDEATRVLINQLIT